MAKLRKIVKKVGRAHAKVFAKTAKFVTPVVAAAATVFGGPIAGLAVTAAASGAARYAGATAARAKGIQGRDARAAGVKLRKKVLIGGLIGTGGGLVASAGIAAIAGTGATSILTGAGRAALSKPATDTSGIITSLPTDAAPAGGDTSGIITSLGGGSPSTPGSSPGGGVLSNIFGTAGKAYDLYDERAKRLAGDRAASRGGSEAGLLGGITGPGGLLDATNEDGSTNWTKIALIGGGVFLLLALSKKAA